ncbi:hypothetical protein BpHYR1_003831 [Brachionus plicatilis]|uniref:Uncharacterized protein n=1 Tax=Brachionus plicatilis TaxID=10195 RepID=A0A3M7RTE2_BRAPC|nr:hypothetical protein BpHYR1_003831 [Brachionus plicatilis]
MKIKNSVSVEKIKKSKNIVMICYLFNQLLNVREILFTFLIEIFDYFKKKKHNLFYNTKNHPNNI